MKKLLLLLITVCCSLSAMAADFTVVGISYDITSSTEPYTVEVTTEDRYANYSGDVVIPASVTYQEITYAVTSIGFSAFYDRSALTSITIPESVTSIGDEAFDGCTGLTAIAWNAISCSDVESYNYYGPFYDSRYSITNFTFGNKVQTIPKYLCWGMGNLTSITIPESVTSIGSSAFYGCNSLTSITIPNSVTSIGDETFSGCSGLTSINIPNSVTSIGDGTFYNCRGLTSITIPNSITSIGDRTFSGCSGLTSINIPNSITSIGDGTFYNCRGLTSITIPESVTSIGSSAFYGCNSLTSITIPNSVTSIGDETFSGCSGLTSINIPNSVTSIGDGTFYNCRGLTSITIPNSITSIGDRTFSGCSGLTSINIPNSITSIGDGTFYNCRGLTSITIPNSVTSIGMQAFSGCSGLTGITIPESVTGIGTQAFSGCTNIIHTTCLATLPPDMTGNDVFGNYNGYLYVPCNSKEAYTIHSAWGCFRHIFCTADNPDESADETTTDSDDVTVVPSDDEAVFTWPAIDNAVTYTLEITKDGVVFCTLRFDGYGRLLGIAFVQGKGGQSAPATTQSAKAYQFTVTGLSASSLYAYSLQATDRSFLTIASYKGTFNTTGTALPSLDVAPSVQIIGRTIICNTDFRIYSLTGQDLTAHNGSLPAGVYIVRTATSAQKVLVE